MHIVCVHLYRLTVHHSSSVTFPPPGSRLLLLITTTYIKKWHPFPAIIARVSNLLRSLADRTDSPQITCANCLKKLSAHSENKPHMTPKISRRRERKARTNAAHGTGERDILSSVLP
jgi:hypothetical protein